MKKLFFSLLTDSAILCVAIKGLYFGAVWASNITVFIVWTACLGWWATDMQKNIVHLANDKDFSTDTKSTLYGTETWHSLIMMLLLVSVGRWFSAIAVLFTLSFRRKVKEGVEVLRRERAARPAEFQTAL